ncbi:unnamed protein product [Lactuca saligna]|uniref:Uncharacterized protein n=1 Tax=Lactuca saligna TaxID=75948 RepID=A0AA35Y8S4_LACSI|nr:unnamed protein product [Lactuca saligna]
MNSTSQNHAPTASSQDVGGSGSNQENIDSVDQQDGTNIEVVEKAKIEFQNLEAFVQTLFQEYESSNASKKRKSEGFYGGSVPGSSSFGSSISSGHHVGFKKLLSDIASITRDDDELGATCSEETEAYCRSVEFDYDVEEVKRHF